MSFIPDTKALAGARSFSTEGFSRVFTTTQSLGQAAIQVVSTQQASLQFTWEDVDDAERYRAVLYRGGRFSGEGMMDVTRDVVRTDSTISLQVNDLLPGQDYTLGVVSVAGSSEAHRLIARRRE